MVAYAPLPPAPPTNVWLVKGLPTAQTALTVRVSKGSTATDAQVERNISNNNFAPIEFEVFKVSKDKSTLFPNAIVAASQITRRELAAMQPVSLAAPTANSAFNLGR